MPIKVPILARFYDPVSNIIPTCEINKKILQVSIVKVVFISTIYVYLSDFLTRVPFISARPFRDTQFVQSTKIPQVHFVADETPRNVMA